jgi:membrane protease YdiL (CAAX protease family)
MTMVPHRIQATVPAPRSAGPSPWSFSANVLGGMASLAPLFIGLWFIYGLGPWVVLAASGQWWLGGMAPWLLFTIYQLTLWLESSMPHTVQQRIQLGLERLGVLPWLPAKRFWATTGWLVAGQAFLVLVWGMSAAHFEPTVTNPLLALGPWQRWLFTAMAVVGAPVFEELIFRGWLQPNLERAGLTGWMSIALSAGLFALLHQGNPQSSTISSLVYIGLMAVGLGIARARTQSVLPAMVAHALHNGVAAGLLWASV